MKTLEKFCSTSPPKRKVSKLKKYEQEIIKLYLNGYQVEQIQEFLNLQKIEISTRQIYQFLKKNLNKNFSLETPDRVTVGKKSDKTAEQGEVAEEDEINLRNFRNLLNQKKDKA